MTPKGSDKNRLRFEHEGRLIYEWEQSLDEVNIYIIPPPGLKAKEIDIVILHDRLRVGVKGTPPFIDEFTGGQVKKDESFWTLVDDEVNINLQKAKKGETWDCALVGVEGQNTKIDDFTKEEAKKNIMLQRFQEEASEVLYFYYYCQHNLNLHDTHLAECVISIIVYCNTTHVPNAATS